MKKMTPLSVSLSKRGAYLHAVNSPRPSRIPNKKRKASRNFCRNNRND